MRKATKENLARRLDQKNRIIDAIVILRASADKLTRAYDNRRGRKPQAIDDIRSSTNEIAEVLSEQDLELQADLMDVALETLNINKEKTQ